MLDNCFPNSKPNKWPWFLTLFNEYIQLHTYPVQSSPWGPESSIELFIYVLPGSKNALPEVGPQNKLFSTYRIKNLGWIWPSRTWIVLVCAENNFYLCGWEKFSWKMSCSFSVMLSTWTGIKLPYCCKDSSRTPWQMCYTLNDFLIHYHCFTFDCFIHV